MYVYNSDYYKPCKSSPHLPFFGIGCWNILISAYISALQYGVLNVVTMLYSRAPILWVNGFYSTLGNNHHFDVLCMWFDLFKIRIYAQLLKSMFECV